MTGGTASTNFPVASPFQAALGGDFDAFVTKIGPAVNLAVSPASLTFTRQPGSPPPAAQSISVSSAGAALSLVAAASTSSWLSVSPASATTPVTLTVSINPTKLAAGTYSAAITLTSTAAGNSPRIVAVTLRVSPSRTGI